MVVDATLLGRNKRILDCERCWNGLLVDKQHILWAPNSTDASSIPAPDDYMVHKLGVVYADGSTGLFDAKYYNMAEVSAIEHTNVALSKTTSIILKPILP